MPASPGFQSETQLTWTIRAPFADELPRVLRMLPKTQEQSAISIAVTGRVERIIAAAVLHVPADAPSTGWLRFTCPIARQDARLIMGVLMPLVQEADDRDVTELLLVGSVTEAHPLGALLEEAGFHRHRETEVYCVSAEAMLRRTEPIYQRLLARKLIPQSARAVVPAGGWVAKLRLFLDEQQQTLSERLNVEEGFTLEHSLILVLDGEVKGAFFTRNRGRESYIGLMLLHPSLRGGLAWANTFMMREMLQFGRRAGVECLIGEVHRDEHRGSREIARAGDAKLLRRQWQYKRVTAPRCACQLSR